MVSLNSLQVASLNSLPVGALLWNSPEPSLTVLTKLPLRLSALGIQATGEDGSFHAPAKSLLDCPLELYKPGDFAPRKARCDILLTGNAYAVEPSKVIGASLRIGTLVKRFFALASEPSDKIPLSLAYLRTEPSPEAPQVAVGPLSSAHPDRAHFRGLALASPQMLKAALLPIDFDFGFYNSAPKDQQIAAISPGMGLSLHGLAPGGATIRGKLPTKWPRIYAPDERRGHGLKEIPLVCDTLWIDTERGIGELTFRGTWPLSADGRLPARLIAMLIEAFEKPDPAKIEARMALVAPRPVVLAEEVAASSGYSDELLEMEPEEIEPEEIEPDDEDTNDAPAKPEAPPRMAGPLARIQADDEVTQLHFQRRTKRTLDIDENTQVGAMPRASALPSAWSQQNPPPAEVPQPSPPVAPPASGLPFLRRRQTVDISPENHPLLAALPFSPEMSPKAGPALLPRPPASPPAPPVDNALPFARPARPKTLDPTEAPIPRAVLPFTKTDAPQAPKAPATPPVFGLPPTPLPPFSKEAETLFPPPPDIAPPPIALNPYSQPETFTPKALETIAPHAAETLAPPPPEIVAQRLPDTLAPPPPETLVPRLLDTMSPPPASAPVQPVSAPLVQPYPMVQPTSLDRADPTVRPPWAEAPHAQVDSEPRERQRPLGPPLTKLGLLPLEKDAEIQVALWQSAEPLHDILEKQGIDELTWREHVRIRDAELREEAEGLGNAKALAVHDALENARQGPPGSTPVTLDLEAYAELRSKLREASDKPALLAARGIDLATWERDHRWYRKQLMKNPALAERFMALSTSGDLSGEEARSPSDAAAHPPAPSKAKAKATNTPARPKKSPKRRAVRMAGKQTETGASPPSKKAG